MTLDESDKQTSDNGVNNTQENVDGEEENISKSNPSTTTTTPDVIQQEESMQWTSSTIRNDSTDDLLNNNNNNNKAAIKRTFDQISDGSTSSPSQCLSVNEESNNNDDNKVIEMNDEETMNIIDLSGQNTVDNEDDSSNSKEQQTLKKQEKEPVTFKVVYAKEIFDITQDLNDTISILKNHLQKLTSVNHNSQKLCYKGNLSDTKTLKECGIKNGVKVMMIGSKATDILAVSSVTKDSIVKEIKEPVPTKEPLCQQKQHKNIIDKGLPEQVMSGWIGEDCPLPLEPLTGMLNKFGNKVRMTFKLEQDEVWISTKERTQKIQMTQIKSVISEPILDHQQYHIMALQIGTTEGSKIWLYWVPAQYVRAIKTVILNS
ncbi:Ubiquitin domain-containing protein ubfd1 [Dermatophagoides pteronyssinus]|uniref:Ubiquitin domain-containing protein ubfd1 n=1 Tax=Dermatophagoides pteronyssinus TaxID=6956 RepID=A0ABQ8J4F7_DERPT|nr:Ubiquitin domain-containing protein ubfd1 [Dermatophagoides pteronyssinus]